MPWRKPYEVYAASTWLLSALLAAVIAWAPTKVPPEPIYSIAVFCLVMGLYRVVPGIKMWRVRAGMSGKALDFITLDALEKRLRDDALWIGWGFEWTQREAQLTSEVMGRDLREIGLPVNNNLGAPWIHGIGAKEKPYYLDIDELKQHAIIVGTTGTGKTRMLALMVSQVIARGDAVVVIDPKSDIELKNALAQACDRYPARHR